MATPGPNSSINADFPNASPLGYLITSEWDDFYNCIAHALCDNNHWWWPGSHWSSEVECEETLSAFIKMFKTVAGYEEWAQENGNLEAGYEKIAIYADADGKPTHAARQLNDGSWTSKIGQNVDISHPSVQVLEDSACKKSLYGNVVKYLRRPKQTPHSHPS